MGLTPDETTKHLDRIERKLDAVIAHLGLTEDVAANEDLLAAADELEAVTFDPDDYRIEQL